MNHFILVILHVGIHHIQDNLPSHVIVDPLVDYFSTDQSQIFGGGIIIIDGKGQQGLCRCGISFEIFQIGHEEMTGRLILGNDHEVSKIIIIIMIIFSIMMMILVPTTTPKHRLNKKRIAGSSLKKGSGLLSLDDQSMDIDFGFMIGIP